MATGAGMAASESSQAVMSLLFVRSVFLSAGNMKVIGVMTQIKNKKCFLGHVVHMTSQKQMCSETLCTGNLSLENCQEIEPFDRGLANSIVWKQIRSFYF